MNEFVVNDFLILKLEDGKTNIYVNGEPFMLCKFLMFNIPTFNPKKFNDIESVDEIADILGWTENGQEGVEYNIDPETEFWGHCSNLQVWYENNYDTRLLHGRLSFPLLKELARAGDPLAKKVLKEEIIKRFESGYPSVVMSIYNEDLLDSLNGEELAQVYPILLNNIERFEFESFENRYDLYISPLKTIQETGWVEENFIRSLDAFFEIVDKYLHEIDFFIDLLWHFIDSIRNTGLLKKYHSRIVSLFCKTIEHIQMIVTNDNFYEDFYNLLNLSQEIGLIEETFPIFLENINVIDDDPAFSSLLRVAEENGLMNEYYLDFLETIDKLPNYRKYPIFYELIEKTELYNQNYSQIEKKFLSLLENIDSFYGHEDFSDLFNSIKSTELRNKYYSLIETKFLALLSSISKLPDNQKYYAFSDLFNSIKSTDLKNKYYSQIESQFLTLLNSIENHPDEYYKHSTFTNFIDSINNTELMNKHYTLIETQFLALMRSIDKLSDHKKYFAFSNLLKIKNTELLTRTYSQIEVHFLTLVEIIERLPDTAEYKYAKFKNLLELAKIEGLNDLFFVLIENIDKVEENYEAFSDLVKIVEKMGMIEKYIPVFLEALQKVSDLYKNIAFSKLIRVVVKMGLIEEYFPIFLELFENNHFFQINSKFYDLIFSIKTTDLVYKYYSRIESLFLTIINELQDYPLYHAFISLLNAMMRTNLQKDHFPAFLELIYTFSDYQKYCVFSALLEVSKEKGILKDHFSVIMNIFDKIDKISDKHKQRAFSTLRKVIKGTELENGEFFKKWKEKNFPSSSFRW